MSDQRKVLAVSPWVGAAVTAVSATIFALATFTSALDTLNAKLPTIRAIAPWFSGAAIIYCATALLTFVYQEWRNERRERAQKRRQEIGDIRNEAKRLLYEAKQCYGSPGERNPERTPRDFCDAIDRFVQVLVQAAIYEERVALYEALRHLKNKTERHPASVTLELIEEHLWFLSDWTDYGRREVGPGKR